MPGVGTVWRTQEVKSALAPGPSCMGAYLVEIVDGEDPAPCAAVRVLQAHELADWMVGAPKAANKCPL